MPAMGLYFVIEFSGGIDDNFQFLDLWKYLIECGFCYYLLADSRNTWSCVLVFFEMLK